MTEPPGMALYEQVKLFITRKIQDGTWGPGFRLPSEQQIVEQFAISRMTANRALRELVAEGRIIRMAGVGSFVAPSKPRSTLLQIPNIAGEIRERGHDYVCRMLVAERLSASPDIAVWLDLRNGASVFHSLCLHLENGVAVQLEDRYVSPRLAPKFLEQDFSRISPGEYLLKEVPFDEIEHVVDAVLPDSIQAGYLAIPDDEPCLLLTRRTWTRTIPVTWVRCLHPGSRYRLGSRFKAQGNQS